MDLNWDWQSFMNLARSPIPLLMGSQWTSHSQVIPLHSNEIIGFFIFWESNGGTLRLRSIPTNFFPLCPLTLTRRFYGLDRLTA